MKKTVFALILLLIVSFSCSSEDTTDIPNPSPETGLYFPPINSETWETRTVSELNWNVTALQPLLDFVEDRGTKAFLILKDGKIVVEWYGNGADASTNLVWNSAAKNLAAFTTGIAQIEGHLNINDASNLYLGEGWSNLTPEQETDIKIRHHLTMTTGLDYTVPNNNCTDKDCFDFKNEPGTFWYYHNGAYTILHEIVAGAVNTEFKTYFNEKLRDKIGMQGAWVPFGYNNLYFSTARSMARFGLLNLNKGVWDDQVILNDEAYFDAMTNSSQNHNIAYGYLYWLNGKDSYRGPGLTFEFQGKLIPNAPNDLYAGLGKDDQKMYVVPSQNLVIIRMGNDAGESLLGPSSFDNELWGEINKLIN
ncbi:serine hydrolase [Hyunsoonleella sp. SJ7]|uniref:Serine hydrolase n=1 Tax=Hyunsoonleella aquatilis TaxID=2762758 RepID=A0A923HFK2_9FLAO|nr:serine hydrolase domain-containing protein [Hyunsoonleella aquatilis]MBC3757532.1 serine hydrolase [Hyunsoonleella aquatilis]